MEPRAASSAFAPEFLAALRQPIVKASDADPPRDADAAPAHAPLNQASFLLALAITTGAMLALEVLDTRVLSVLTWYSLGFLVIGMGLFGLTAGAVDVYLRPQRWAPEELGHSLAQDGVRFAVSIAASAMLLLVIPLRVELLLTTLVAFLAFAAAIALPFFFAGRIVAAALTRTRFPPGRVYAADLVGAALGAPLVVALLGFLDGTSACIFVGGVAALGAALFAHAARDTNARRRALIAAGMLGLFAVGNGATDRGLRPLWIKGRAESRDHIELELWNSHSRVQLLRRAMLPAAMWGAGGRCKPPTILQQGMEIDGHAATPIYLVGNNLEALRFLECDVTHAAHQLRKGGEVAIIGVGGSRDVQAALLAGHTRIVGIELNGRLLEILDGPLGAETGIRGRKEVTLVHDEARSYLTRNSDHYDLIQASLIDTWAATGAGAHALSENGLYTVEAIQLFLDRLKPGGLLSISRWASVETARLTSVVHAALLSRGVEHPRDHMAVLAAGPVANLIVGRDPLTAQDLAALGQLAQEKGFLPVVVPGHAALVPRIEGLLSATSREELDRRALEPKLDFRPSTDERPFFFNVVRLGAVLSPPTEDTQGSIEGNLVATQALAASLLTSFILVVLAVVLPLARRKRAAKIQSRKRLIAALVYFSSIGVGFMLAEIALLMKLSLVLGHPSFSLMVVLSSLVAAAGLGSLASDRLPLDRRPWVYVFPAGIALLLAALALGWPSLSGQFVAASTAARVSFAVGVSALLGACLGVAFPVGLRLTRPDLDAQTPWFWGMNGVGSVVASGGAVALALGTGLTVLLYIAAGFYLILLPCAAVLSSRAEK
ncbi:MAG TPA: hypothetical protein PKA88_01370 [Polyangiaceae bacterium]|nr:hypothetical protein [Polyangiaceae bacterium]